MVGSINKRIVGDEVLIKVYFNRMVVYYVFQLDYLVYCENFILIMYLYKIKLKEFFFNYVSM